MKPMKGYPAYVGKTGITYLKMINNSNVTWTISGKIKKKSCLLLGRKYF
jgi:hypothetical protein